MTLYRRMIERAAKVHNLDPDLVEAIVVAESGGLTDAFRFEPVFFDHYLKGRPEYDREIPRRVSSSYGLMQVMFTTAQQYGFVGPPELLFVPETGLRLGCQHLAKLLSWADRDLRQALAAYNGGQGNWHAPTPQAYAAKVLAILGTVRSEHA